MKLPLFLFFYSNIFIILAFSKMESYVLLFCKCMEIMNSMNRIAALILITFSIFLYQSCNNDNTPAKDKFGGFESDSARKAWEDSVKQAREDSIKLAEERKVYGDFPLIKYNKVIIKNAAQLKEIRKKYNHPTDFRAGWKTIQTLNRKEFRYIRVKQAVVIPDTIIDDIRAYSIFPQFYEGAKDLPKIIMVSTRYQCYGAYEYGKLVKFAAVNSGKEKTPTFPGRYALVWKERVRRSSLDSNWIMPFTYNFHGEAGNAFHQFEMPGYPASHSCVRQFMDDAEWLFNWGEGQKLDKNNKRIYMSGTPVVVLDHYDFSLGHNGEWKDLKSNRDVILDLPDNPMQVEEAIIPICQIPHSSRGRLKNRKRFEKAEEVLRQRGIIREHVVLTPTVNYNIKRRKEEEEKLKAEQEALKKQKQSGGVTTPANPKPGNGASNTDNKTKTKPDKEKTTETPANTKKPAESKPKTTKPKTENPPD